MSQTAIPSESDTTAPIDLSQIADGDIVEVVLRGPAKLLGTYALTVGARGTVEANTVFPDAKHVVSITKVEPSYEPQAGDVVRDFRGNLWTRAADGEWIDLRDGNYWADLPSITPLTLLVRDGQVVTS